MSEVTFKERKTVYQVEEEKDLAPKFDENGLIPVVTTDFTSGELLMHGYMNVEAFKKTIELGEAVYYSRSREVLWHKGATSGLTQIVKKCASTMIRTVFGYALRFRATGLAAMWVIVLVSIEAYLPDKSFLKKMAN